MVNVVITGSTRGIGLAMAMQFLESGCNVTLSGRGEHISETLKDKLLNYKEQYIYISCDVQEKTDNQRLWDLSYEKWGSIDFWINNAGINAPNCYVYETDIEPLNNIIQTNITGMIYGTQVAMKGMLAQGKGSIYSMEGLGSNNMIQPKTILYGMTKHALTYYMKGLAKELKSTPLIIGRLSPGMMYTDFITKTTDGKDAHISENKSFKTIFNILADYPETVANFFIPRMLNNTKKDVHIVWLTNRKIVVRFLSSLFIKRSIIK